MDQAVVLLVEDRPGEVTLIQRAFEQAGVSNQLFVAHDGEEAIQYLNGDVQFADRDRFPLPHIVILDLKMPRVDGFGLLRWLKAQPELRSILPMVLTYSTDPADVERAYELGAKSFIIKPGAASNERAMAAMIKEYCLLGNKARSVIRPAKS